MFSIDTIFLMRPVRGSCSWGWLYPHPLEGSAPTPEASEPRRLVMVAPRIADEVGGLIQRTFAAYVASFTLIAFQGMLACDDIAFEAVYPALTARLGIFHPWASSRTLLVTQLWCGAERARGIYAERKFPFRVRAPRFNDAVVIASARGYSFLAVQNVGWLMIPSSVNGGGRLWLSRRRPLSRRMSSARGR